MTPKPSLDNAYAQVARGGEHLQELKVLCEEFCVAQARAHVIHTQGEVTIQPNESIELLQIEINAIPIPGKFAMLTGEAANAFRSALNYLIGQLALLDTGRTVARTQFPIEDSPSGFRGKAPSYLNGLSGPHIAAIKRLQPCEGCTWTGPLAKTSNVHKHDDLVLVTLDYNLTIHSIAVPDTDSKPGFMAVKMDLKPVLRVSLRDGMLPLIETLEVIQSQVAQTLDAFQPEFKG